MTTFNFKNYEDSSDTKTNLNINNEKVPSQVPSAVNEITDINSIQVMVTGPISEIVAKALNEVFKNTELIKYTEEANLPTTTDTYMLTLESNTINKSFLIYTLDTESIRTDPLLYNDEVKNVLEYNTNKLLYIDTQSKAFNTTKEEWFLLNSVPRANKVFYSLESLSFYLKSFLKNVNN